MEDKNINQLVDFPTWNHFILISIFQTLLRSIIYQYSCKSFEVVLFHKCDLSKVYWELRKFFGDYCIINACDEKQKIFIAIKDSANAIVVHPETCSNEPILIDILSRKVLIYALCVFFIKH